MSDCMRSLNSSDQRAPGFTLLFAGCRGASCILIAGGLTRGVTFRRSVARVVVELAEPLESFMQVTFLR